MKQRIIASLALLVFCTLFSLILCRFVEDERMPVICTILILITVIGYNINKSRKEKFSKEFLSSFSPRILSTEERALECFLDENDSIVWMYELDYLNASLSSSDLEINGAVYTLHGDILQRSIVTYHSFDKYAKLRKLTEEEFNSTIKNISFNSSQNSDWTTGKFRKAIEIIYAEDREEVENGSKNINL